MQAVRVIHLLWAVIIAYWFVSAFGNKRTKIGQSRGSRLAYVLGLIAVGFVLSSIRGLHVLLLPVNAVTQSAGVFLCAAGMATAIWARHILGKNWSGYVSIKQDHELIQSGPYRFVRHPIYSGLMLAIAGTVLATTPTGKNILVAMAVIVALYIKSRQEERILKREFGGQYAAYKQRVKAALIPWML